MSRVSYQSYITSDSHNRLAWSKVHCNYTDIDYWRSDNTTSCVCHVNKTSNTNTCTVAALEFDDIWKRYVRKAFITFLRTVTMILNCKLCKLSLTSTTDTLINTTSCVCHVNKISNTKYVLVRLQPKSLMVFEKDMLGIQKVFKISCKHFHTQ